MLIGTTTPFTVYSYCRDKNLPIGHLLNREDDSRFFLEKYKNSSKSNIKILTEIFYTNQLRETAEIKSTEKLDIEKPDREKQEGLARTSISILDKNR